ncbi:hypothetical protein [Sphingomonas sp.]|uniref:hypothetical protein n=1 Tax=Sphingomonas sp. TaxID=28214 RepID=UPI003D6CF467
MADADPEPKYSYPELIAAVREGALEAFLKAAQRALGEDQWASLVTQALEAHQAGEIDLLAALAAMREGRLSYGTQQFLEHVLPALTIELKAMIELIASFSARAPDDGIAHYLLNGFVKWCEADAARPLAALTAVRAGEAPAELLRGIFFSGLRVDYAHFLPAIVEMLASGTPEEQQVSAGVLGRFDPFTQDGLEQVVTSLETALSGAIGDRIAEPLRALLAIAMRAPDNTAIGMRALENVARKSDAHVRQAVATEMMFDIAKAPDALAAAALALLHGTEQGEMAAINAIDHILSHDLAGRLEEEKRTLLDTLLARRTATMTLLASTARTLLTGNPTTYSATIVRWLTSDNSVHVLAVRDLCTGFGEDAPRFDLDFTGLPHVLAERIAKRCCALLMVFPETIASILASLMRTGPTDAVPLIEQLLFDPLLITYWSGPRVYLESVLPGAPAPMAEAIVRAIEHLDRYIAAVEAVRDLPELRPSQHRRFLVETKRREGSLAINKAAQRQSIFAEIFPTSILLYGDAAIFDIHVEPGKVVRNETPMQSHEFSHELPRLDVIDPFGFWFQREQLLRGDNSK